MKRFAIIIAFVITACAQTTSGSSSNASTFSSARPICEVLANPGPLVGKRILIRALYLADPHVTTLFDRNCTPGELELLPSPVQENRLAQSAMRAIRKRDNFARIPVVYSGVLKAIPVMLDCSKPSCFRYALDDAQIIAIADPE